MMNLCTNNYMYKFKVDGKPYCPVSYDRFDWATLSDYQKSNLSKIWNDLTVELKEQIKNGVATKKSKPGECVEDEAIKKNWNVDDTARLIHMWADPRNSGDVTKTTEPFNRMELDNKLRVSPWVKLADKFNEYNEYVYSNPSFSVNSQGEKMGYMNKDTMFYHCGRLNPTNSNRPPRDEENLKTKMRGLKTTFSLAYTNYKKSGFHDAEDPDIEFWKYCNGDITLLYAFSVWSTLNITQLGKLLDENASFDSTVNDLPNVTNTHTTKKRKVVETPSSSGDVEEVQFLGYMQKVQEENTAMKALDVLYNS